MKNIYLALIVAIIGGITLTGGDCDDSTGTGGGTQNDPNVLVFENLIVAEVENATTSPSALNLLTGRVDSINSNDKDITLVDLNGNGADFYFRSGDMTFLDDIAVGYQTVFGQTIEYTNLSQTGFDTLSKIWSAGTTLDENDFANQDTRYPGNEFFGLPPQNSTVYTFFLKGKKQAGITANNVYGILRIDTTYSAGGIFPFRVSVDAKINIGGQNQFLQQVPVQ